MVGFCDELKGGSDWGDDAPQQWAAANARVAWALDGDEELLRTTDDGATWQPAWSATDVRVSPHGRPITQHGEPATDPVGPVSEFREHPDLAQPRHTRRADHTWWPITTPWNAAVTPETPRDLDRVSSFLNIRAKDIEAVYAEWSARGAQFLTPPKQDKCEIRCYIRDPDRAGRRCSGSPSLVP